MAVAVFISRMDPTLEELNDVKTAVSEAVTNSVIHGYENGEGVIYIETGIEGQELTVSVRDEGIGIADVERAPAWDFPLWRHSWTRWTWNRSPAGELW